MGRESRVERKALVKESSVMVPIEIRQSKPRKQANSTAQPDDRGPMDDACQASGL